MVAFTAREFATRSRFCPVSLSMQIAGRLGLQHEPYFAMTDSRKSAIGGNDGMWMAMQNYSDHAADQQPTSGS